MLPTKPSSIMAYRDAVVTAIKGAIPASVSIQKHDGYFDIETLKRLVFDAPAVYVAVMHARPVRDGANSFSHLATGEQHFTLDTVCFVVTTHIGEVDASDIGWAIGEVIMNLAVLNAFTDPVMPALDVKTENLWSNKLDDRGCSLLTVSWQNDIVLGTDWSTLSQQLVGALPGDKFGDSIDPNVGLTLTVTETINEAPTSSPGVTLPVTSVPPEVSGDDGGGSTGNSGADASFVAAVAVFAGRAVMFDGALDVEPADPNAVGYVFAGIATQSAAADQIVIVRKRDAFQFSSWNWVPGEPVFVLASGVLTQSAPVSGVVHQIGSALDATTLLIEPGDPVFL